MPGTAPLRIAFYVSGHGFGHATRASVTIQALLARGHSVTIVSSAPRFIFKEMLHSFEKCSFREVATLDSGVIQRDPVTVDVEQTMKQLGKFLENMDDFAEQEEKWLIRERLDVICLDAPFLPAYVAKKLGIATVLITNFTFDAIFDAIAVTAEEKALVERCVKMYAKTDALIRLPGHMNIPSFKNRPSDIVDVPLIVRMHKRSRESVREELKIPTGALCALITFGGFELPSSLWTAEKALPEGWFGILACPFARDEVGGRLRKIHTENWYLPDLINAVDVVVGKCGYGTCSEVVAHHIPLVYVPRIGFAEEKSLVENLMETYGYAVEMPQEDFYSGQWNPYILRATNMPKCGNGRSPIGHDGDILACDVILEIAQRVKNASSHIEVDVARN